MFSSAAVKAESESRLSRLREEANLGVETFVDPVSGQSHWLKSGNQYGWIDNAGHIIGTDTYWNPGLDFHALVRPR